MIVTVATEPAAAKEIGAAATEATPLVALAVEVSCASMLRRPTLRLLDWTKAAVEVPIVSVAAAPPPLTATPNEPDTAAVTEIATIVACSVALTLVAP